MLSNKLGITNEIEFAHEEERLSKIRAIELYEQNILSAHKPGSLQSLQTIHGYLFQDIYDFAGAIRNVNISKGGFRFVPVMYLNQSLEAIQDMPQETFDQIVDKYVEMNVAHPFREGNGRSMRIWLDQMLRNQLQKVIDWQQVTKEDYLLAMERSPVRATEIKLLLQEALTDEINNREVFMKGIDTSYLYEGYSRYKTEELI